MHFCSRSTKSRREEPIPTEIYLSVVDSLYVDSRSLFMGAGAVAFAILLTAWKTGEPSLYLCAMALGVITAGRGLVIRAYTHRRARATAEEARKWEFRYVVGTCAHVLLLGAWCVLTFTETSDPFAQFVSITSTVCNLIGIAGRNFGSSRLVAMQILCAWPFIIVALLSTRNIYYTIFASLFVAFFASLKFISDRLRGTLLDALVATRDVTLLASRFDTALNNMPHGLCMFDAEQRLVVTNHRLSELLNISPDISRKGASLPELLGGIRAGVASSSNAERFATEFENRLSSVIDRELVIETRNGRVLAFTFHPMESGGSVVLVEDITERKAAQAKISRLARYDPLTELPNRTHFREQMAHALGKMPQGARCAVLFIDLDQFKQVNDTLGHQLGDAVLRIVADRLRALVRDTDIVSRFAGDEFVILQMPVSGREQADDLARRIVSALSETYDVDVHQVVIGASIGIAMVPKDGLDGDILLKNADMALYRAKSEGRAAWRFFEPEMNSKAQARRSLELDLRDAFINDAFEVYYQPLINLKSQRISTCEALLRWRHADRGMVSPADFIPVAEEMGLIVELGNRVLRRACVECVNWPSDIRVAVNLSPIQFKRGNVTSAIKQALTASGLAPGRLEVEITESTLLQDTDAVRATLQELRDFGVRISLDDFGTGHSSLSYLHSFPLHKVKIDRSFLEGIGATGRSMTLLRGVANLSAELGMSVAVEGIETEEQLALIVAEKSIDEAQGFLFSPALPSSSIRTLLSSTALRAAEKVA